MANVLVEESNLSNIAQAIRGQNGGDATYKPSEMAAAISNLSVGGNEDVILTHSGSGEYVNNRITTLGSGAFLQTNYSKITLNNVETINGFNVIAYNDKLTELNLPALKTITSKDTGSSHWSQQIARNKQLQVINLPELTTIDSNIMQVFANSASLTEIKLPNLTAACLYSAFSNCSNLRTIDLSSFEKGGDCGMSAYFSFNNCRNLTSIDMPNLTSWASLYQTFANCSNLQTVNMPKITGALDVSYTFSGCSSLQTIKLNVTGTASGAFSGCSSLTQADVRFSKLENNVFRGCSKLRTLILRPEIVVPLSYSDAFGDTLIGTNLNSGIYVPKAVLSNYKTATNWATYSNYIYAIEDYPDITGGES